MDRLLNKDEVRAQLADRQATMQRRIDALEDEVATSGDDLRDRVQAAVLGNPLVIAGAAVGAGLLVGLLFGGRGRRKGPDAHRALVDAYIDAVAQDARRYAERGRTGADAVREALQDRVPLVVYEAPRGGQTRGFFANLLDLTFKTAVGFAVKAGVDYLSRRIELDELILPDDDTSVPAPHGTFSDPLGDTLGNAPPAS